MRRALLASLVALTVLLSGVAPALAVGGDLNYDDKAPNPTLEADTTVDQYQIAWGDDLQYEADDGNVERLPAELNRSTDVDDLGNGHVNPFTFTVTDINFSDASEFPRNDDEEGENSASALDASEWSTTGATVSDTTTAPEVDAVEFSASTAGDQATYDNFTVSSDAEKRYFQAFYDVNSASGASVIDVTIHDATDGDTAVVELYNSSATVSDTVGANSTGEGKAMQVQLGELSASGGDGTIDEIGSFVVAADGSADVKMSALNLEKTGKWQLGVENTNTDTSDDDEDLESDEIYTATGPISVDSMSTLGSTFDSAEIMGVTFPAQFNAAELADENIDATFNSDNDYPQWDVVLDSYYRLTLPDAYDLSYANAELNTEQKWPSDRYVTVDVAEDVGEDTEYEDIDSWSDQTSAMTEQGETHALDQTVQVGVDYVVHFKIPMTQESADALQAAGGGAAPLGSNGDSFPFNIPVIGGILAAIAAALKLR